MTSWKILPLASRILPLAACLLLPLLPLRAAHYDLPAMEQVEQEVQAVADKAMPCIVALTHPEKRGLASGSGCIIGQDGLILTAAHVVGDAKTLDVTFPDRKLVHAKVLGADYRRDVALALITEPGEYPFVELGDSKKLEVGDLVVALGHPGGFDPQRKPPVRFGRVFQFAHAQFIRTDCTLISGDSGGPLFDLNGRVVGVHCSVGADMSENNDAPAEAVRDDWSRLMKGDHWGKSKSPMASKLTEKELGGLDLEQFQEMVMQEAIKNKGEFRPTPEKLAKWMMDCGMKPEKVKAMSSSDLVTFMQKALGDGAKVAPGFVFDDSALPSMSAEELAGLDLKKFRKRVIEEGLKKGGRIEAEPDTIKKWLLEYGMKEGHVKAMKPGEMVAFVAKALGSSANVASKEVHGSDTGKGTLTADDLPPGLDLEKFKGYILDEAVKHGGKIAATPSAVRKWLKDCGVKEEAAKAFKSDKIGGLVRLALGGEGQVSGGSGADLSKDEQTIVDQDKEMLDVIKPGLDKIGPSIVALGEGDKTLALGTVVKENGFILTKHSEVAKAKALQVHLSDGRTLPGVEVQQFPEQDLSLVKVAADGLHPASIPGKASDVHLGSFLFSPGLSTDEPLIGQGVVSVLDRSLKQSGGYLGIALNEINGAIEVTDVMVGSPAARAGLQKKDQILSVDDATFRKVQEFSEHVRSLSPDSVVHVKYRRGTEEKVAEVTLADRAKIIADARQEENPVTALGTEVSDKRTGFPVVFQHDQPLKPEDCGSVVLNLHGEVVGVNIARAGRVDTYAIPSKAVAELLNGVDFHGLEEKAASPQTKVPTE